MITYLQTYVIAIDVEQLTAEKEVMGQHIDGVNPSSAKRRFVVWETISHIVWVGKGIKPNPIQD